MFVSGRGHGRLFGRLLFVLAGPLTTGELTAQVVPSPLAACDTSAAGFMVSSMGRYMSRQRISRPCPIRNAIDTATLGGSSARTLSAALAGRLASATVLQSSGVLGGGSRVRLRGGYGLVMARQPLLIIDGIRSDASQTSLGLGVGGQTPSRLDDISVDDIERIDVLPGPAAAAEYGAGAAGGVILVTTKRGASSETRWRTYVETGLSADAGDYPDNVANGPSGFGGSTCTRAESAVGQCVAKPISRWNPLEQASPFRTGVRFAGGASATGQTKLLGYYLSGSGSRDEGPLAPNDQNRHAARANIDFSPAKRLHVALRGNQLVSTTTLPYNGPDFGVLRSGLLGNPVDDPVRRGYLERDPATIATVVTEQHIERASGSASALWTPIGNAKINVKINGFAGREVLRRDDARAFPLAAAFADPSRVGLASIAGSTGRDIRTTFGVSATARFALTKAIAASTTLGTERLTTTLRTRDSLVFGADGMPTASTGVMTQAQSTRVGLYGSQLLGWDGKRLEVAIRRDGRDERYLLAPATSWSTRAAWDFASASFLPKRSWMRGMTVHASYGVSADSRPIMTILQSATGIVPNGPLPPGTAFRSEHVSELELGASLPKALYKDLSVDVTAFRQSSDDAYEPGCCIGAAGFDDQGKWHTLGAELSLRKTLVRDFHTEWHAQLTASVMHNEYDGVSNGRSRRIDRGSIAAPYRPLVRGSPIGGVRGQPLVGRDANGDGVITPAEISQLADSVYLGAAVPTRQASFATTFTHRRLTLSGLIEYYGGHTTLNATELSRCTFRVCDALYEPGASVADQTRAVAELDSGLEYFERADFARLREVALTYKLAPTWAWRMGMERFDLTLAARNLWTITGYTGSDPEVNVAGQTTVGTVDHFTQPIPRTFLLRVTLHR